MDSKLVLSEEEQTPAADELDQLESKSAAENTAADKPVGEKCLENRIATLESRVTNYIEGAVRDLQAKLVAQESTIKDLYAALDSLQQLHALKEQVETNGSTTCPHSKKRALPEETDQGSDSAKKQACSPSSLSSQA
ncbi:hypothetical protein T484DRAFT_1756842 [Baffinella frigidus]|nr:hypothetical protein T484DRAFT_1756842 [Cryptophyta sp. CCMP2293]